MARPARNRPTDQELEILKVLWDQQSATVRQVWQCLSAHRELGYTSVLKIVQIMRDKGLVLCDTSERPQRFRAAQPRATTLKRLAGDLLDRAFNGSTRLLLLHAIESRKRSGRELAEIRQLLEEIEGR